MRSSSVCSSTLFLFLQALYSLIKAQWAICLYPTIRHNLSVISVPLHEATFRRRHVPLSLSGRQHLDREIWHCAFKTDTWTCEARGQNNWIMYNLQTTEQTLQRVISCVNGWIPEKSQVSVRKKKKICKSHLSTNIDPGPWTLGNLQLKV